jgi:hypothetical protein
MIVLVMVFGVSKYAFATDYPLTCSNTTLLGGATCSGDVFTVTSAYDGFRENTRTHVGTFYIHFTAVGTGSASIGIWLSDMYNDGNYATVSAGADQSYTISTYDDTNPAWVIMQNVVGNFAGTMSNVCLTDSLSGCAGGGGGGGTTTTAVIPMFFTSTSTQSCVTTGSDTICYATTTSPQVPIFNGTSTPLFTQDDGDLEFGLAIIISLLGVIFMGFYLNMLELRKTIKTRL